eukprot:3830682-Pyramimonas_sp.AAC.1
MMMTCLLLHVRMRLSGAQEPDCCAEPQAARQARDEPLEFLFEAFVVSAVPSVLSYSDSLVQAWNAQRGPL